MSVFPRLQQDPPAAPDRPSASCSWRQAAGLSAPGRPARPLVATKSLLQAGADGLDDPLLIGEFPGLELGVDQLAVEGKLEGAAADRDQLQILDLLLVGG